MFKGNNNFDYINSLNEVYNFLIMNYGLCLCYMYVVVCFDLYISYYWDFIFYL